MQFVAPAGMSLVGVGLSYLADRFALETILSAYIPTAKVNAYLMLSVVALAFCNHVLASISVSSRGRYGVKHPITYPTVDEVSGKDRQEKEANRISFISAIRGHENFTEWVVLLIPMMFAAVLWAGIPRTAALCGAVFAAARIIYGFGYAISPSARIPGFVISLVAYLLLLGTLISRATKSLGLW